ncbi:unnamed protein product, partial [Rotaria sp. Silwood1]
MVLLNADNFTNPTTVQTLATSTLS